MKQSIIRRETKRLHYQKYLYKVEIYNELSSIFRTELNKGVVKLSHAKKKLDEVNYMHSKTGTYSLLKYLHKRKIDRIDYIEACNLYNLLLENNDYKIRCENSVFVWIYTNDKNLLESIINECPKGTREYWTVEDSNIEFLQNNINTVIVSTPPTHIYKCFLNSKDVSIGYGWIEKNRDKIKIGEWSLRNIQEGYANNNYFYVRDEKTLLLVQMVLGNCIRRIERLIYKGDIDKYTYESN